MSKTTRALAHEAIKCARDIYGHGFIPLHRPIFEGNERQYLVDCIDSNFVSSVGARVTDFESQVSRFIGTNHAVAAVNGTAALHIALKVAGVEPDDEVISQALTFVATCNAITYTGADPVFVDVDLDTLGLSPRALDLFLEENAERRQAGTFNKLSGKRISACVPMHTFGFPCRIRELMEICERWDIKLVEDAAESLGSYVGAAHTGTFSSVATLSFNGNKVITTGGGGMLVTNDRQLAMRAKHLTTTAKIPHAYEFMHDEIAYNYRMPNLNAALGCAQMERLRDFLSAKARVATYWESFCRSNNVNFVTAIEGTSANHWLNAVVLESRAARDEFLEITNKSEVMTRPIWTLMSKLPMFEHCQSDDLRNSLWLEDRVVNLPSSVPNGFFGSQSC